MTWRHCRALSAVRAHLVTAAVHFYRSLKTISASHSIWVGWLAPIAMFCPETKSEWPVMLVRADRKIVLFILRWVVVWPKPIKQPTVVGCCWLAAAPSLPPSVSVYFKWWPHICYSSCKKSSKQTETFKALQTASRHNPKALHHDIGVRRLLISFDWHECAL